LVKLRLSHVRLRSCGSSCNQCLSRRKLTLGTTEALEIYRLVLGDLNLNLQLLWNPVVEHESEEVNREDLWEAVNPVVFYAYCLFVASPAEEVTNHLITEILLQAIFEIHGCAFLDHRAERR
jgi:hypothetical protein